MSKMSKKLLSLVIVLAMVLSMTPVISLPAAAIVENPGAEQDPATAAAQNIADVKQWIADNGAKFDGSETVTATCPFCGAEDQTWEGITTWGSGSTADKHFYLTDDYEGTTSNFFVATSSVKTCLYMNGKDITGTKARFRLRGTPLNIIAYDSVITRNDGSNDYVLLQDAGANNTVNIYGGTFINNDPDIALIQRTQGTTTYNLYEGSYSSATTSVVAVTSGTTNAFNCTFTGGTTSTVTTSGGTFNMYGGSISGGTGYVDGETYYTDENGATHYGTQGGNVYMAGGTFNLYGGSIYGGTATGIKDDAGSTKGGRGGNVYIGTSSTFNMYGGKIYGGQIEVLNGGNSYGGNVMLYPSTAKLTMSGDAEIYGGQATNGGNVQLRSSNEMTMSGNAKVYNGVANTGGNIYLMNGSNPKLTMSGNATVYGGTNPSEEPNNIRLYGGTLVMKDNATVLGGAKDGSAISVMFNQDPLIVLSGNATVKSATGAYKNQISDGRILITEGWAGEAYASLVLDDGSRGYTYGEQVATTRALRGSYDEETGAVTAADAAFTGKLYVSNAKVEALADSTVVGGIKLAEEAAANEPVFGTFDPAGCEGMAYCEACYKQAKAANPNGTEDQWKAAALKEWTVYTGGYYSTTNLKETETHEHLYLNAKAESSNIRFVFLGAGTICLELNGYEVVDTNTATGTSAKPLFVAQGTSVLNIMDSKGTSLVTGESSGGNALGSVFYCIESAEMNLYGGTYTKGAAANGQRILSASNGGQVNIYDGVVIDGRTYAGVVAEGEEEVVSVRGGTCVYIQGTSEDAKGVVNMYGGKLIGGKVNHASGGVGRNGGAVTVGYSDTTYYAEFNLFDGEIVGGRTDGKSYGGAVYVYPGAVFNMSGGKIYNGSSASNGGNVYVDGGTFNMSGGQIYGGTSDADYDNVYILNGATMIMSGTATITGGTTRYTALFVGGTGDSASTLVLRDSASVVSSDGSISAGILGVSHSRTGTSSNIVVEPGWTGQACAYLYRYYQKEDESWTSTGLTNGRIVEHGVTCGTYNDETGVITPAYEINGNLYAMNGTRPVWVDAQGTLYIPGYSIETAAGRTWKATFAETLESYQLSDAAYIGVWTDGDLALPKDAYVAAMVNSLILNVSGSGKLYVMDTSQDDFVGTPATWNVADGVEIIRDVINPVSGNRYLNITTGTGEGTETITSTRLDLGLKTVTLRAGKTSEGMGLYYKAQMSMSEALADKVTTYGVVLSLVDMPYANFADEGKQNGFTALETKNNPIGVSADNDYTVTLNSGSVFGIMKTDYETLPEGYATKEAYNAYRGEQEVFANVYLEIDLNGDGTREYVMADTDTATENDIAWSMYEVLDTIDGRWSDFASAQQKLTEFYSFWHEHGMNQWTFDNIKKESV